MELEMKRAAFRPSRIALVIGAAAALAVGVGAWIFTRGGDVALPIAGPAAAARAESPEVEFIRLSRDGIGVISGRAPRNAQVRLFQDGDLIGTVEADEQGGWMLAPKAPLRSGASYLKAEIELADGSTLGSRRTVFLALPSRGFGAFLESGRTGVLSLGFGADPAAPPLVLQRPGMRGADSAPFPLTVQMVETDGVRPLIVTGTGKNNETIRLYVDDRFVGELLIPSTGRWSLPLGQGIAPGPHHVRVDQMFSGDTVDKRLSYGFTLLAAKPGATGPAVETERGYWRILAGNGPKGQPRRLILFQEAAGEALSPETALPGQHFERGR